MSKAAGDGARATAWILGSIGLAAAVALISRLGVSTIILQLATLGSVLPLVLLVTAFKYPMQTAGWRLALPAAQRPPWWRSLRATLAGDAVGYLTFAGPVTGEPLRASILRHHLAVPVGIAAGALERAIYALTGTLMVVAALLIVAVHSGRRGAALAIVIGLVGASIAVIVVLRQPPRGVPALDTRESGSEWRNTLAELWRKRRPTLAAIAGFCLIEHVLLLGEARLMLRALGTSPSLATVVVFEGMSKLVNTAGAAVPGRLGVMEAGTAAVTAALHVGASAGLSLALMRRLRALIWGLVGLCLWAVDVFGTDGRKHALIDGVHDAR